MSTQEKVLELVGKIQEEIDKYNGNVYLGYYGASLDSMRVDLSGALQYLDELRHILEDLSGSDFLEDS